MAQVAPYHSKYALLRMSLNFMIRFRRFQTHRLGGASETVTCSVSDCPRRLFGLDCLLLKECLSEASGSLAQRCIFLNDEAEVQLLGLKTPGSSMELHANFPALLITVAGEIKFCVGSQTLSIGAGQWTPLLAHGRHEVTTPSFADFLLVLFRVQGHGDSHPLLGPSNCVYGSSNPE